MKVKWKIYYEYWPDPAKMKDPGHFSFKGKEKILGYIIAEENLDWLNRKAHHSLSCDIVDNLIT